MRRLLVAIALVAGSLLVWASPASAYDIYMDPALIDLGAASTTSVTAGQCVSVPYRVYNAGRFRLQYRGPDGAYRYAERTATSYQETGWFKLCTKTTWAKGAYWLRSVHMDCGNGPYVPYPNTYYDRAAGTVRYCDGDLQMHGLNLTRADFTLK